MNDKIYPVTLDEYHVRPDLELGPGMFKSTYGVETKIIDGRLIEQSIDLGGMVTQRVIDTGEYQVRQALIALGWTPPKDIDGLDSSHGATK